MHIHLTLRHPPLLKSFPVPSTVPGTWGFHRPPLLPESRAECAVQPSQILAERSREAVRQWSTQGNWGIFTSYNGAQVWSTNDRVADLYREYI